MAELVITEKPSVARSIATVLGDQRKRICGQLVHWSSGRFRRARYL